METAENIQPDKLRGVITEHIATSMLIPEKIVEKVISFQFKHLRDSMKLHPELYLYRFGYFRVSKRKVVTHAGRIMKDIEKLNKIIEGDSGVKRKNAADKLPLLKARLKVLQQRLENL